MSVKNTKTAMISTQNPDSYTTERMPVIVCIGHAADLRYKPQQSISNNGQD
jgi:hypothetical protein